MRKLLVWHNLNKDTFYYKFSYEKYKKYDVGFINQYNHKLILKLENEELQPIKYKVSLSFGLLTLIIFLLKKFLKFLEYIKNNI